VPWATYPSTWTSRRWCARSGPWCSRPSPTRTFAGPGPSSACLPRRAGLEGGVAGPRGRRHGRVERLEQIGVHQAVEHERRDLVRDRLDVEIEGFLALEGVDHHLLEPTPVAAAPHPPAPAPRPSQ